MSEPAIELDAVGRVFPGPSAVEALRAATLRVETGEHIALVGRSGSGKTTLLNILGLLDTPSTGLYRLFGEEVSAMSEPARALTRSRTIGFVFQTFHLVGHRTALDNVALGLLYGTIERKRREETARTALARVGLSHRMHAPASTLSGGEQQRVAIARAVAKSPRLLLCDEPTGDLDSETAEHVLSLIDELHRDGLTVVVVTHDHSVAGRASRVLTVADGVVFEQQESRSGGSPSW